MAKAPRYARFTKCVAPSQDPTRSDRRTCDTVVVRVPTIMYARFSERPCSNAVWNFTGETKLPKFAWTEAPSFISTTFDFGEMPVYA